MPIIPKSERRPWMPTRVAQSGRVNANVKFYQSRQWRKVRALKIAKNPCCQECLQRGVLNHNNLVVDHITPINLGGAPLDFENLQTLCAACHNRKSGREAKLIK